MEISVMGSSQVKMLKGGENVKVLGICENSSIGFVRKTRVCFGEFKKLRNSNFEGLGLTVRAVHAHVLPAALNVSADCSSSSSNIADGIRLFVGLPVDVVSARGRVNHEGAITAGLKALKLMGILGVELPVSWGVVEKYDMGTYDWSGYLAIAELVQKMGLKLQVSLCFHASQQQKILLPDWVSEIGKYEPSIYFTDRSGRQCKDCLSLSVDEMPILNGKSPVQVYQAFSETFKSVFSSFMGSTITGISIGLGPDGELRYPSCHHSAKPTKQLGVGEFQCYDKYMLSHLKDHAEAAGCPLWGLGGPHDVPGVDEPPSTTNFFRNEGGSWETPYGDFFLSWYSSKLLSHGDRILSLASNVFSDLRVTVSGKVPLMHSWYQTRSHPSELTAGFYNTADRDGYDAVAEIFANNSCRLILPGMDMSDEHQATGSSPRSLLAQIKSSCTRHRVGVSGQNVSVAGMSKDGFEAIQRSLSEDNTVVDLFMYQRMGADFFSPKHFPLFSSLIRTLNQLDLDLDVDDMPGNQHVGSLRVSSEARASLQAQTA